MEAHPPYLLEHHLLDNIYQLTQVGFSFHKVGGEPSVNCFLMKKLAHNIVIMKRGDVKEVFHMVDKHGLCCLYVKLQWRDSPFILPLRSFTPHPHETRSAKNPLDTVTVF